MKMKLTSTVSGRKTPSITGRKAISVSAGFVRTPFCAPAIVETLTCCRHDSIIAGSDIEHPKAVASFVDLDVGKKKGLG